MTTLVDGPIINKEEEEEEAIVVNGTAKSNNNNDFPDPEEDAINALKTVKNFILSNLTAENQDLISDWGDLDEYIIELCDGSLETLKNEPQNLSNQESRFLTQLEDVSCGHYRALIEGFKCAGSVREGVGTIQKKLETLITELPKLANTTRLFSQNVALLQNSRERSLRTASESLRILELLEIPKLMQTLLLSKSYNEVLELRDYSLKFNLLYNDDPIINSISKNIRLLSQQMVFQLLNALNSEVDLSNCLKIVGYLRRLDIFPIRTLKILFLNFRGEWMNSNIQKIYSYQTSQAKLISLCNNTRAMMFEIITQYKAIFNDDDDDDVHTSTENGRHGNDDTTAAMADIKSKVILYDWTSSCISNFLEQLELGLKSIHDGLALNTILQQAMYCGHSLGRVGGDFRANLPPMFNACVLRIFNGHLMASRSQFENMLEDHRWAPVGTRAGSSASNQEETTGETGDMKPPLAILDSPPLAVFLNGILAAINDLRLCAPSAIGPVLARKLEETILDAAKFMNAIGGPGGIFLKPNDRNHFTAMITSLRDLCLPHAARCLDYCMGTSGLIHIESLSTGVTEVFGGCAPLPIRVATPKASPVVQPIAQNGIRHDDEQGETEGVKDEEEAKHNDETTVVI